MLLTVCVVSGRHVRGGAAIDDCIGRQVGEVGQRPHQPSSIWLQEQTVKEPDNKATPYCHEVSRIKLN